jgi:two-component system, OmpR family, sensor histidine kinase KdpD
MLEEAQELKKQGIDLVVGYFEPHARPDTIARLTGLEVVPRRVVDYRGSRFEDMDVQAILNRAPQFCVVDEFPHTNVPGSERGKRWEDVFLLLDHGIDVSTTMNVQHFESLNDQIYKITGVRVRETIPDWIVQQAAEVVMVDLTPRALLNRLERGVVYHGEKAQRAKEHFFKESTLVALREFALRETAFEIESRQGAQNAEPSESINVSAESPNPPAFSQELVLVYINEEPSSAALIRRGKRVADYLHGKCIAVAICPGKDLSDMPAGQREALEKHLNFARNLHVKTHLFTGDDVAGELVSFSRQQGVTQIYLARPPAGSWNLPFKRDLVQRVARLARDMEVTIVADRTHRKV